VSGADVPHAAISREGCELCWRVEHGDPSLTVTESPTWKVFFNEHFSSPSLVWVCATDHVEGLWALTDVQATSWAVVLRRTARAMREAYKAERVYVAHFGENQAHFHAVMLARPSEQVAPSQKGVPFLASTLAARADGDVASAAASAKLLRAHLGVEP
jgi:diadenosine tetraphosphate (Ap4A) HIT family hydrolase